MTTENEENEAKEMMEEDQLNNQQDVSPKEKNGDETGTDKKDQKCVFYPNCTKQDTCPYFHPTELCKAFPSCTYGKNCRYIHPEVPCKYGIRCQRMGCSYAHPKKNQDPCPNGFSCPQKNTCEFSHPVEACKFGTSCTRAMCPFSHTKPCKFGPECKITGCSFSHLLIPIQNEEKPSDENQQSIPDNNNGENKPPENTNQSFNLIINPSDLEDPKDEIEDKDEFINIED